MKKLKASDNNKCMINIIAYCWPKKLYKYVSRRINDIFEKMQIDMLVFLNAQIDLLQSKTTLLDLYYKVTQTYIELEFNVGAQLQTINKI